jgi:hypothetical protein
VLTITLCLYFHYSLVTHGSKLNGKRTFSGMVAEKDRYSLFLLVCCTALIFFLGFSLLSGPPLDTIFGVNAPGLLHFCSTYNFIVSDSNGGQPESYCRGKATVLFLGAVSSGKTTVVSLLNGRTYVNGLINPNPSTDKFVCMTFGTKAQEELSLQSDDRKDCEILDRLIERRYVASKGGGCDKEQKKNVVCWRSQDRVQRSSAF